MPGAQTAEQRQAAVTDAGYTPAQQGQVFAGQQTTAPTPITYAADSVNTPASLYKVPTTSPVTPTPDYYKSVIAGIPPIASITGALSPDQENAKTTQQSLSDKILGVIQSIGGKSTAQTTAETAAGIPDLTKNLTDITAQMTALKNEADAIPLQIENDSAGMNRTQGGIAPLTAGALRENTIKQLGLSTIAATLQGNLALAQQQADKAIAVQFDPLQSELDYLKEAMSLNADTLSEADKEQQTIITAKLQERQDALDTAKSDYQTVQKNVITATQNGAPAAIVSQAFTLPPDQAAALLAPYLKTPVAPKGPITVSPGQTVIDPVTGTPIYTAPGKTPAPVVPTVVTSGTIVATPADIKQGSDALTASASKGAEADGTYADPNLYLQMYQHWVTQGGKGTDFLKTYPFATYINPANTWLSQSISDFNQAHASGGGAGDGTQTP